MEKSNANNILTIIRWRVTNFFAPSKNDSSIGKWQTEVVTPLGIVTVNHGDALISLSAKEQLLGFTVQMEKLFSTG